MRFTTVLAVMLTVSVLSFSTVSQQLESRSTFTTGTDKIDSMPTDASGKVHATASSVSDGYGTENYSPVKYSVTTGIGRKRNEDHPISFRPILDAPMRVLLSCGLTTYLFRKNGSNISDHSLIHSLKNQTSEVKASFYRAEHKTVRLVTVFPAPGISL